MEQSFASRLNLAIRERGLSKGDVATKAGIHRGTLSRWLSGTTGIPESENLHSLASVLHVTTSWLMTGEGDKEPVNLQTIKDREVHYGQSTNPNENFLKALAVCLPHLPAETLLTLLEIIEEYADKETLELKREILQLAKSKL